MDNILITRNDKEMIAMTNLWLSLNFKMKVIGKTSYVLDIKIIKDRSKRLLGFFPKDLYKESPKMIFFMQHCKPIDTLVIKSMNLSLENYPKTHE